MQTELLETQPDHKHQQPLQIKLKHCGVSVPVVATPVPTVPVVSTPVLTVPVVSPPNTKRTQKAKSRTSSMVPRVLLPNSIEEIIGDMHFEEPRPIPCAPVSSDPVLIQQQANLSILSQKQQELLVQLQQGIRPGWFIQCIAKRADGKQCTRNIKKGSEFCMGHSTKCVYGRITDLATPISEKQIPSLHKKFAEKSNTNRNRKPGHIAELDMSSESAAGDESDQASGSEDEEKVIELPADVRAALRDTESASSATTQRTKQPRSKSRTVMKNRKPGTANSAANPIPDGTQTESVPEEVPTAPKKRGRRRKLPIDPRFGNDDYIIMWPIICEDQRYLTDRNDNIYSNDPARPVFIGIREVSGKINRSGPPKIC